MMMLYSGRGRVNPKCPTIVLVGPAIGVEGGFSSTWKHVTGFRPTRRDGTRDLVVVTGSDGAREN